MKRNFWPFYLLFLLVSCGPQSGNHIELDAELFINHKLENQTLSYQVNLDSAYFNGIEIPSASNEFFKFSMKVKNPKKKEKYYYRIYYQNKSYKHREFVKGSTAYNKRSAENFYGSWESPGEEFKMIEFSTDQEVNEIIDSFKIVGNPRNEIKYYGLPVHEQLINDSIIAGRVNLVYHTPSWLESVKEKAKEKNRTVEQQIYLDALWTLEAEQDPTLEKIEGQLNKIREIESQAQKDIAWRRSIEEKAAANQISFEEQLKRDIDWILKDQNLGEKLYVNNRKKRNPRMGTYEFMLVVVTEQEFNALPESIRNIGVLNQQQESFMNPFYFFDSTVYAKQSNVYRFQEKLRVSSLFSGENGVYINPLEFKNEKAKLPEPNLEKRTGSTMPFFQKAHFEQYFHVIDKSFDLKNVPIVADVINDPYTRSQYEENKKKYPIENRAKSHTQVTKSPGETVFYNDSLKAIQLYNSGSQVEKKKENVGVQTRVGLSYGTYTAKIKFPKMINQENVWNGLTCAFWLFSESMNEWNGRDVCTEEGYMKKGDKKDSPRFPVSTYSEIDIEIVKTSKHWPKTSYPDADDYKVDDPANNHNLTLTTTNWDLACPEPEEYSVGVVPIKYKDMEFGLHRWDKWYHATTSKFEYPHDQTVGDIFYYQIEWRPTEIIWRIGPSKDQMQVFGYMNEEYTKIPNNQMISIVTQEFHYADWWPLAPFDQNNVPFPKNNINGFVYSIEVE